MWNFIPNVAHVHTFLNPVSHYLHCAYVLRQRDAFPPLPQPIVFQGAENMAGAKQNKPLRRALETSTLAAGGKESEENAGSTKREGAEDVQTWQRLFTTQAKSKTATISGKLDTSGRGQMYYSD